MITCDESKRPVLVVPCGRVLVLLEIEYRYPEPIIWVDNGPKMLCFCRSVTTARIVIEAKQFSIVGNPGNYIGKMRCSISCTLGCLHDHEIRFSMSSFGCAVERPSVMA